MKSITPVWFIIFISCATTMYAQQMMPVTRTVYTPHGPAKITTFQNTGMPLYYYQGKYVPGPYVGKTFLTVALQSDSVFTGKLFFNIADSIHSLTLERKEKKGGNLVFYPNETKQISQMYKGKLVVGIPVDSCWLFKLKEGKINSYAPFPNEIKNFITAIQKGDGPILPMTKENLKNMVADQPKLFKMIDKKRYEQVIWKYNNN